MESTRLNSVIKISATDNVGIVANPEGLPEGTLLQEGIRLIRDIPMGNKVALKAIKAGEKIIRYGQVIGHALEPAAAGEWLKDASISLPEPPDLKNIVLPEHPAGGQVATGIGASESVKPEAGKPVRKPLEDCRFLGYRNSDGCVGTKNLLGITTSVNCVAGFTNHIENKVRTELLPKFPNVDGVVALNHTYGCGIAIDVPSAVIPIRTLRNIATNPNFGGEVLVVSLGCEKLRPERLLSGIDNPNIGIFSMQYDTNQGFGEMVEKIMKMAETHLIKLNGRTREECPLSDLVVGMQCGGSDVFSGITANPAAGFAADLIVQAGGSVLFSEVSEVRDALHLLLPRIIDPEVGKAMIEQMQWYDDYLEKYQTDRTSNPSPGNKSGGLANIVEKALGSIAKSGTSRIVDVLGPGEKIRRKGLSFAATPASDFVCGTLQLAAGMNMHVFLTGRGTPYGLAMVPVLKVGSNPQLSNRWGDLIDLDAGRIATGEKTIEETGWELFNMILDVASGRKQVASDRYGLYNDLVLFDPGPVT